MKICSRENDIDGSQINSSTTSHTGQNIILYGVPG